MTTKTLIEKVKPQKIGKAPVVVLPFKLWQEIENRLEELEMAASLSFRKKIAKARSEKKLYSAREIKKALGIS